MQRDFVFLDPDGPGRQLAIVLTPAEIELLRVVIDEADHRIEREYAQLRHNGGNPEARLSALARLDSKLCQAERLLTPLAHTA